MSVTVGSARIDENGKAYGGAAGDQTGKEVSTQSWYKHSKGWRTFRAKDSAKRKLIASAMRMACKNNKIGYDQYQRLTLYNAAKLVGFDTSKVTTACETDCSALVRVCCAYAGITVGNFRTTNEASMLLGTGEFVELTGSKYNTKSDYLLEGDIQVTKTQGHTIVVLSNGSKAEPDDTSYSDYELGERILRNGSTGNDVRAMQSYLINLGFSCGSYGADGDYGDCTEQAVEAFQAKQGLEADGVFGASTYSALKAALANPDTPGEPMGSVVIVGGNCYVRAEPGTSGKKLGIAREGSTWKYAGATSEDGWLKIARKDGATGWVSGKYGRLMS